MNKFANKKLLYLALSGILASAAPGCQTEQKIMSMSDRDWQALSCDEQAQIDLLSGLGVDEAIDGLIVYQSSVQIGPTPIVVGGNPCTETLERSACAASLAGQTAEDGNYNKLIVISGEDITVYATPDEVMAWLGSLDNQSKVMLWMHLNGIGLSCSVTDFAVANIAGSDEWFGSYTEYSSLCGPVSQDRVEVSISTDGQINELSRVQILYDANLCIGRMPPGQLSLHEACQDDTSYTALGQLFARHAAYEGASVVAFNHLKNELAYYGAPQALLDKIQSAANDEVRHAQQVQDLAERFGAPAQDFEVAQHGIRSLEEIAMDNLSEGCIGETWGALVGLYQAEHAQFAEIRQTMQAIAADEVGHAALSWEIHHWLLARLDLGARLRLQEAQQSAVTRLLSSLHETQRSRFELQAGLPSQEATQSLAAALLSEFEQQAGYNA